MRRSLFAIAIAILMAGPVAASDTSDVMASIHGFVDSFNKGDTKAVGASCSDQAAVIDEFPPYEWHGAGACAKWMSDYDADARKNGIAEGVVTLSAPRHVDVAGDRAYVVVPANYEFKKKGKPNKEVSSMLTLALQKEGAAWRITGWAWAKH